MAVHKVECWFTEEWLESPFFLRLLAFAPSLGDTSDHVIGEAMFLVFVAWLFVGLAMSAAMRVGGRAARLALVAWGLTFLLELHHPIRAVERGGYYPGLYSSIAYLAIGVGYWRALMRLFGPRRPERAPARV